MDTLQTTSCSEHFSLLKDAIHIVFLKPHLKTLQLKVQRTLNVWVQYNPMGWAELGM